MDRTSIDQTLDLVQEALGDRYLVTGPLAQGGMSLLLRGRQTLLDQPVAIKVMHANAVGHRALRERFLREARILASLQVPQITRVYDAGSLRDGRLYLVLELLQGENLETISERGPMSLSLAARVLMEVCDGLIAAHDKGIIHRDLKPENVFMVQREDGTLVVKLLDFGIAKDTADQKDVTGTYTIVGSPLYVPPEQIASSRTVDKRADIWAMGVMLYQLVLQRHPFEDPSLALLLNKIQNEPLPPFPPDSDPMFEIIVERCLAKNPEDRYGSANELKDALVTLAEQLPQQEELDDMPTLGPRMAPIGLGLGMAHLATERPPMSEQQPSSAGAPSSGNDMTLHVPVPGSPGMPQILPDQRPVTAPIGLQVQHHAATAPSLQTPPELGTQPQGQRQSSPPPEVTGAGQLRTPEPQPVQQHLQQVPQGQPVQPQNQRVAQKTIPIGRPFLAPPAQQQQAPQDSHVPRAPRGGMTAPLMQPFTLPQGPPGPPGDQRMGSSPGMAAQPVPTFAEPLPDPRRQAPTVVVPRKAQRPMWPFVALGVAIVLAMVAVAMVLKR